MTPLITYLKKQVDSIDEAFRSKDENQLSIRIADLKYFVDSAEKSLEIKSKEAK